MAGCSCFDAGHMPKPWFSPVAIACCVLALPGARVVAQDRGSHAGDRQAEPSLGRLLRPTRAQAGDVDRLAQLLAELEQRTLAKVAAAAALVQARAELDRLRQLRAQGATADAIERRQQIVWAALLLVDRLIARAEHAAALQRLEVQARSMEAEARRARAGQEAAVGGGPSS
jgi:hypothetical protein